MGESSEMEVCKHCGDVIMYCKCYEDVIKSIESEKKNLLERAIELLANNPGKTAVLKELGQSNNMDIVIKDGRYGIYVTNGKVNVTLPKGMDYNTLDLNTALDLISKKKKKKRFYKR